MKCIALASVFLAAASFAHAADIARPVYKAPVAAPVASWTGYYGGINGGYAWHDRTVGLATNDPATSFHFPVLPNPNYDIDNGFVGFQIGYNWQLDQRWVTGLEADFQFGSLKGQGASPIFAPFLGPTTGTGTFSENTKWFGTVRARLGFLLTGDILVYGTGGLAYGDVERNAIYAPNNGFGATAFGFSFSCPGGGVACFAGNSSKVQFGWTAGGGAEWTLWKNVTFKAEYLYVNLGDESLQMRALAVLTPGATPASFTVRYDDAEFHIVRAGLNLRF